MFRQCEKRRIGSSMTEVIITLLILAVALTSVVSLFPLAAITMGQALKDDRTVTCAITADGYIRDFHRQHVVEIGRNATEPYYTALDTGPGGVPLLSQTLAEPSYPVVIDPVGYFSRLDASRSRFGDAGATLVPRVTLSTLPPNDTTSSLRATRLFYQLDGLSYDENGVPIPNAAEMRELRYSWLYVVQRPVNRDRFSLTLSIAVFDKRSPGYAPPGSEAVYGGVQFVPGMTQITRVPAVADVRKGMWVMDATIGNDVSGLPVRNGKFYRVTSVTDENNGFYTLELHTPVTRADGRTGPGRNYTGTLVVLPGVADVFERPMLSNTSP